MITLFLMPDSDYESLSDNSTSGSESYKKNPKLKKTKKNIKETEENIQKSEENIQKSEENIQKSEENIKETEENIKETSLEEIFKKRAELLENELLENKEITIFEEKKVIKNTRTIRISNRSLLLLKR